MANHGITYLISLPQRSISQISLVQMHMLRAIIAVIMHDNGLMIKILIQGDTNVRKNQ